MPRRKPHPAQLKIALQRLGVEPAAAVYIGDTPEDVAMARHAGVVAVGVEDDVRSFRNVSTAA